jgi:hypothetical protein
VKRRSSRKRRVGSASALNTRSSSVTRLRIGDQTVTCQARSIAARTPRWRQPPARSGPGFTEDLETRYEAIRDEEIVAAAS